jgi:hypothetical protein
MALLQSLYTAALTISGIRVTIGLSVLAAAASTPLQRDLAGAE